MGEGFVAANAPGIAQQFTGRRCHLLRGNAFDGDIRRRAVKMLGILRAAHGLVFSGGAVAAADGDGGSELITQRLPHLHKGGCDKAGVGTVGAGKFSYAEIAAELFLSVLGFGIDFHIHPFTLLPVFG